MQRDQIARAQSTAAGDRPAALALPARKRLDAMAAITDRPGESCESLRQIRDRRERMAHTTIKVLPGGKVVAEGHGFEGEACQSDPLARLLREIADDVVVTRKPEAYQRVAVATQERATNGRRR